MVFSRLLYCAFFSMFSYVAFADFKLGDNFVKADYIVYNEDEGFAEASGNVEILSGDNYLKTERALIDIKNHKIWVDKEIFAQRHGQKLIAKSLYYDQSKDEAILKSAEIEFKNLEILRAKKLVRKNHLLSELYDVSYTPCIKCINDKPIWSIEAKKTEIDFQKSIVKYHNVYFKLGGYKVMYLPYFSHYMQDTKAVSGILKPELDKNTLKIPFYYRAKPNMDITYSPRFNKKYFIHELEYRHLLESGQYKLTGSYTKTDILTKNDAKGRRANSKYNRYYVNSFGDFSSDYLLYGYNIGKVSDKAYLKNFYLDHRNAVKSTIYLNDFRDDGYNHFDLMHFQGLRALDSKYTDESTLPNITLKRNYDLMNDWNLSVEENAMQYNGGTKKNIARNSLDLELTRSYFFDNGQIVNTSLHNKTDIYSVKRTYLNNKAIRNKNLFRNIPELKGNVTVPLFFTSNENIVVFEPQMNLIVGRKKPSSLNRYELIDSPNYDINESNIFNNTRYNGIDFYESGARFSYGLNNYAMGEKWQVSSFLGQLIRSETSSTNSKSDYVGKINYNYLDNLEIYYRFQRKNRKFKPNRDEVSVRGRVCKLSLQNIWISLRDLAQYSNIYSFWNMEDRNIIKQNYTTMSYQLTEELALLGDIRLDISTNNNLKVINDSVGISYNVDCVAFSVKISNDYSYDPTRNIKKTRAYGIKLGLKTINL